MKAAARAADRDARRRQKELERRAKEYEKMRMLEQAAHEVEVYENYIERLVSLHKEQVALINWKSVAREPEPERPQPIREREIAARDKLSSYAPGPIDRWLKRESKVRERLSKAIEKATDLDAEEHRKALSVWEAQHEEWRARTALAQSVLSGEPQVKLDLLKELDLLSEISELGSDFSFSISGDGTVECNLQVHGTDVIPSETKSLLSSGRLSVKSTPKGRFNQLYQDYVCSCVLRVAREMLAIVPDDLVVITATDDLLNTATGHMEPNPILSVAVSRATLRKLNLDAVDPSDSMDNFVHNMRFKKSSGFSAVSRVRLGES